MKTKEEKLSFNQQIKEAILWRVKILFISTITLFIIGLFLIVGSNVENNESDIIITICFISLLYIIYHLLKRLIKYEFEKRGQ